MTRAVGEGAVVRGWKGEGGRVGSDRGGSVMPVVIRVYNDDR